jgi:hypothetical protein
VLPRHWGAAVRRVMGAPRAAFTPEQQAALAAACPDFAEELRAVRPAAAAAASGTAAAAAAAAAAVSTSR